jgi:ribosome maturation factor RimP
MIAFSKVETLIEGFLSGTNLFLVELQVKGSIIVVRIDGDNGVGIDDCVRLSRHLESNLDRDETDFKLDVTSSGVGKPFKIHRQYLNHKGKLIEVTTANGRKSTGVLMEVSDNRICIKENPKKGDKSKQKGDAQGGLREFSLDEILETKATIQFN